MKKSLDALGNETNLPENMNELIDEIKRSDEIKECYFKICEFIEFYMDIEPKYISIIALWIIGTYFHSQFSSYPFLYINAMRGSGKSRLLNIIVSLSYKGNLLNSMTEAVLFRTQGTLAIDEFESATSKELQALRELLNSGYKKGAKVMRMKKKKTIDGEQQVVEEFDIYRPIVMANISGIDQVLQDRCITIVLDKSSNASKTMLVEDFEGDENVDFIKKTLNQCRLCMYVAKKNIYKEWNQFTKWNYITFTTLPTQPTLQTLNSEDNEKISQKNLPTLPTLNQELFEKIRNSGIHGRNFELVISLFLIADKIGQEVLDTTIWIIKDIIKEKRHEEEIESRDVMLFDYVAKQPIDLNFYNLNDFSRNFREYVNIGESEESNESISRALKRLGLIVDKRRVAKGVEVILNVAKAKEKIKIFRTTKD